MNNNDCKLSAGKPNVCDLEMGSSCHTLSKVLKRSLKNKPKLHIIIHRRRYFEQCCDNFLHVLIIKYITSGQKPVLYR